MVLRVLELIRYSGREEGGTELIYSAETIGQFVALVALHEAGAQEASLSSVSAAQTQTKTKTVPPGSKYHFKTGLSDKGRHWGRFSLRSHDTVLDVRISSL